ncbi:MAG: TrkH family potassium uptake protein [Tissierellia bacterium]|nr:TrkH family potassium uptake protein [Tissierellia bacterium]
MNLGARLRILATLIGVEGLFMLPPLILAYINGEGAFRPLAVGVVLCFLIFILVRLVPLGDFHLTPRDGLFIVVMGWIVASLIGALPMYMGRAVPSYVDGVFEIVSGFTTTGASVIGNIEGVDQSLILWRSTTHWIGGMGILVFTLALLPRLGSQGFKIFKAETTGPIKGKIEPKMSDTARRLYIIYILMSLVLFFLLLVQGMGVFDSIVHTFGTVGTGGFSSKAASISVYRDQPGIILTISFFLILCGTNFSLYMLLFQGRGKEILKDEEFRTLIGIIGLSTLFIMVELCLSRGQRPFQAFQDALFQVVSIISTAGFYSVDFDLWPRFSKYILFLLMFAGSCAGSTAGGIKIIRVLIMSKLIRREIIKVGHPKAIVPIRLNGKTIPDETLMAIIGFFGVYFLIFVVSIGLVTLADVDLVTAASSVATCLSNVGPAFEQVGPTLNFAFFSPFHKLLFSVLMLLGRLEFFTVFALIIPDRLVNGC